jgi:hypothetical protein
MLRRTIVSLVVVLLSTALVACGPSGGGGDDDPDAGTGESCTGSGTRCVTSSYQTCVGGEWTVTQNCPNACNVDFGGCIDCTPGGGNVCNGNTVVACTAGGQFGATVMECAQGSECSGGVCQRACSADGVDLIYVVDETYRLLSFDPRLVGTATNPFRLIGQLSCPAGPAVPGWIGTVAPFSMAVDREAVAWVLYSSGEIFHVSTQNASCTATNFQERQNTGGRQWDLFGMGFVTDAAGGDTERLWVGGGNVDAQLAGDLGVIDPASLAVQRIGPLSATRDYSPEFTGVGDATLWGFYPGTSIAFVQQLDKTTGGGSGSQLNIPGGLGGTVAAWAFAQWGGKFYIFVTTADLIGGENSTVRTIDRATGQYALVSQNLPYKIVGAGVSTCAPIIL